MLWSLSPPASRHELFLHTNKFVSVPPHRPTHSLRMGEDKTCRLLVKKKNYSSRRCDQEEINYCCLDESWRYLAKVLYLDKGNHEILVSTHLPRYQSSTGRNIMCSILFLKLCNLKSRLSECEDGIRNETIRFFVYLMASTLTYILPVLHSPGALNHSLSGIMESLLSLRL